MLENPPNATHGCTLELGEWLTLEPADARAHSSPSSWPFTFASQHRRHANRRFSVNPKSRRCRSSDRIYALSSVARIAVAPHAKTQKPQTSFPPPIAGHVVETFQCRRIFLNSRRGSPGKIADRKSTRLNSSHGY